MGTVAAGYRSPWQKRPSFNTLGPIDRATLLGSTLSQIFRTFQFARRSVPQSIYKIAYPRLQTTLWRAATYYKIDYVQHP